jgi:hypothetical protein
MSSVLESIETTVLARVRAVSGIADAKAIPVDKMLEAQSDEEWLLVVAPEGFPFAAVSMNERQITPMRDFAETGANLSAAWVTYVAPVYVVVVARSSGASNEQETAKYLAWQIAENVVASLITCQPTGTFGTLEPGITEQILGDTNTYGVILQFLAKYQISALRS